MKNNSSTATTIGHADPHRRKRLIALGTLLNSRDGGTLALAWPDVTDELADDHRVGSRDLAFPSEGGRSSLVTLESQLAAHSKILQAGARLITLSRHEESIFPELDRSKTAAWNATSADVAPTTSVVSSTPRRVSAFITASKSLLKLSPLLASGFLEAQLLSALGAAIDRASLVGDGVLEPFGLLNDPTLLEHEILGAEIEFADLAEMERIVAAAHGEPDAEAMVWLADPATRKQLRAKPQSAAVTTAAWPSTAANAGPLGRRGYASPFAPPTSLVYGNFGDLLIIQTSPLELQSNPYSNDTEGFIRLLVEGHFDITALSPSSSFVRAIPA